MNKQILILLSLVCSFYAQNIITSWNYDKVGMYILQKFSNIFSKELLNDFKAITIPDLSSEKIKITNIKGESISQSLYDSYLNLNSGLYLFSPYKLYFSFSFNYTITDGDSGSASFDLKIQQVKVKLENVNGTQTQKVNITFTNKKKDYIVYSVPKDYLNEIQDILYKGFSNNNILDTIKSKINVLQYFNNFYKKKKSLKINFGKYLAKKSFTISLNRFVGFCEDVQNTYKNALCYYSGEIEQDMKDKRSAVLNNTKFLDANDTYNVFINKDLINKMISDAISAGINLNFNKHSVTKHLNYTFTAKDLKVIFEGLDKHNDTEEFNVDISVTSLTISSIKGIMSFNIGKDKKVFQLEYTFSTTLHGIKEHATIINICLEKVNKVVVKVVEGSSIKIRDQEKLNRFIISSFDLKENPICASNNGISVSEYFNLVYSIDIKDEGIYVTGEQLYQ